MNAELTVIIPCRDEYLSIRHVVRDVDNVLFINEIPGIIMVVDDHSFPPLTLNDIVTPCLHATPELQKNIIGPGLAEALKTGITYAHSKYVIFMSGDETDDPEAIPLFYKHLERGYDCVLGQRDWTTDAGRSYPLIKWVLNRLGNRLISLFFERRYSDYTDMFKGYRLSTTCPGLSCQAKGFAFPLELCLRAILSGASHRVIRVSSGSRIFGRSKFQLWREMPEYLITFWNCLKLKYGKKGREKWQKT